MTMQGLNYPTKDELSFTTSEQNTGTTWIDGKVIYKKTVPCGNLTNTGSKHIDSGITNLDKVVNMEGFAWRASDKWFRLLPHVSNDNAYNILVYMNGTEIHIDSCGTDRTDYVAWVTVYYTKAS